MRKFMSIIENADAATPACNEELLMEKAIFVNDSRVTLMANLSATALSQLVDRSPDGHVRGLITDRAIYYWSAFDAVHFEIAQALGVQYDPDHWMEIWDHSGIITVDVPVPPVGNRSFQSLMASDDLYFDLDGQFVPGPQLAQSIQS